MESKTSSVSNLSEVHDIPLPQLTSTFPPISKRRRVSQSFRYPVFVLLNRFLILSQWLLLVPFRFAKNPDDIYVIQTNIVQQILSTLLLLVVTTCCTLNLRYFTGQNLREKPQDLFKIATGFVIHLIPGCWLLTFWFRRNHFAKLLVDCQGQYVTAEVSFGLRLATNVTLGVTFVRFILKLYLYVGDSTEEYLNYATSNILYNMYVIDSPGSGTGTTEPLLNTEQRLRLSLPFTVAGYIAAVSDIVFDVLIVMFDQFCLIGAIIVYATCTHFVGHLDNLCGLWNRSSFRYTRGACGHGQSHLVQRISESYLDLISLLNSINDVFGLPVVIFFMYLYPLFVWSVFERLSGHTVIESMVNTLDILILFVVTGTGAAGSGKMEQFKQWLFEISLTDHEDDSISLSAKSNSGYGSSDGLLRLVAMHRQLSTEAVGLKGCKFFTVTYGFIGTMIGIVITYAIVMLQFVVTPLKPQSGNDTATMTKDDGNEVSRIISELCNRMHCNTTESEFYSR